MSAHEQLHRRSQAFADITDRNNNASPTQLRQPPPKYRPPRDEMIGERNNNSIVDNPVTNSPRMLISQPPPICVGCTNPIFEQFIMKVHPDLDWHPRCLRCFECQAYLDETCTCFVRDGKVFCKADFSRLFSSSKCTKCGEAFSPSDLVMRAKSNVYHTDCFTCVVCSRQLLPGEEFGVRDGGLYCRVDYDERLVDLDMKSVDSDVLIKDEEETSHNKPKKGRSEHKSGDSASNTSGSSDRSSSASRTKKSGSRKPKGEGSKTTRIRTVLNEKQLHTLRTCYAANPRPDALMKEQLVEMSGLSPRVIRVWFQNKRCKDKKRMIFMKQAQQNAEKNGRLNGPIQGIPMVASDPMRHEGPNLPHPLDVQSFPHPNPPLWKAAQMLGDFGGLNPAEMESATPFQQLMSSFDAVDSIQHPSSRGCSPPNFTNYLHDGGAELVVPQSMNSLALMQPEYLESGPSPIGMQQAIQQY